ncbi:MAG: hypothetical protein OEM51_10040 [Gammaproteobacteria bacterium]|nr:hypothetical protein [Gammaproteobacteria bacterium]MDH3429807.1 hypothetical protein [Gammaproteobacteria bacterium]
MAFSVRRTASILFLLPGLIAAQAAAAEPDRDSLIAAWEAYVAALPGTAGFEVTGDGIYRLQDADLPYDGEVKLVGALVRSTEAAGFDSGFSSIGMVDFELVDIPEERLASQSYYYWLSDRQTLYYSDAEQRWMGPAEYQASITALYSTGGSVGALWFMSKYGIWLLLIGLLVFAFIAVGRQAKKARAIMDDSAAINQQARENLDRSQGMQDEVLSIARETRDLQSENNQLLKEILSALKR